VEITLYYTCIWDQKYTFDLFLVPNYIDFLMNRRLKKCYDELCVYDSMFNQIPVECSTMLFLFAEK
jgi:hypothetical protein